MLETLDKLNIASLKGVGAKTLERLGKLGLHTVQDLLFHLPARYEDRSALTPLGYLKVGDHALVEALVELTEVVPKGRRSLVCRISDGTGSLYLRFFHFSADHLSRLKPGVRLRCYGEAREGYYGIEMVHPDYQYVADEDAGQIDNTLTPVYPLTEGLHQKTLRGLVDRTLELCEAEGAGLRDWIPAELLADLGFPSLLEAVRLLHKPPAGSGMEVLALAQHRLAFEEL
ncbi:MAG: ATP-dependent DNA helicase RecG, partial [Candidatus Methylumidiphilus sp.]